MNALAPITDRLELLPPGEGLTLILALHPLKLDADRVTAPAGLTLADLVEQARGRASTRLRSRLETYVDGQHVPAEWWGRVRPKPGTVVLIKAVAEGGDVGGVLRGVLGIAVAAAAIFLAPVLAPILLPGVAGAAGLIGAAITIGGQLLINALFPVAPSQLASDSASQTYSISGGQNVADPFGVVPSILGTNRVYPKLGAKSYTEFSGADQYLRMLVVWGYGPLDIGAIKIGETLLSDFDDVEVETRNGYDADAPLTLFPNEVLQDDLSIDLTAAAGWQTRTTDTGIDEISLDVVAPGGIVHIDSSGNSTNYTVSIRAEYAPTGTGSWTLLGTLTLTSKSTDAIRQGLRLAVANGQYDVRVKKTSTDYTGSDQVQEQVVWTALRGFRNTPPIAFAKPLALTAIRIRATSQLNGVIDNLNAICSSRVVAFHGSAWHADTTSRNPADLFRHVLQGPANAKPQPDSRVDLSTLAAWWSFCDANGYHFDMVRDMSASVFDTLTAIASAGRATVLFRDGKWSVAWEVADDPIVQHFTPRNSWGFSGQRAYVQTPHALRVRFVNQNAGYAEDELIVYDDGYDATNATLFEQVEFPGVTDPTTIWKLGRYQLAQAKLRPEVYSLNADFEHIVATRGDRVRVTHDVPMWGLASGRVKAVASNVVTLDEPLTMVAGHTYQLRFRLADGATLLKTAVTVAGDQTVITLGVGDMPSPGDLFMAGESGAESVVLRIRSITGSDDVSAKLTLVDDALAILDADTGTIPPFDSQITVPAPTFSAKPVNLKVRETYSGTGSNNITGAFFSWDILAGQYPTGFDAHYRDEDGDGIWKAAASPDPATKQEVFITDYHAGTWGWRVRSRFANGGVSDWAVLASQTMLGGTVASGEVEDGSITLAKLSQELQNINSIVFGDGTGSIAAQLEALRAKIAAQAAANLDGMATTQEQTSALIAQAGTAAAVVAENRKAQVDDYNALAGLIEDVEAAFGDSLASGLLKIEEEAGIGGADSTIALRARASTGADVASTGILMTAKTDGAGGTISQILFQSDTIYMVDSAGDIVQAIKVDLTTGDIIAARFRNAASTAIFDVSAGEISITGP